ncbi:PEPxxWA-CTERM sorting domain-containing protein [Novosphingobium sp.]|uniref:PEPxxWA-CTERM sorting domain-containing protein n=1 Tax=Novosphingobium sp. TaxID=1874826 RepID=UPI003B52E5FA
MRLKNWIQPGLALAVGLAAPAIFAAGAANAAPIVYDVSLPSPSTWTLSGTITTDGAIGALSVADITAFDLTATNGSTTASCISGGSCALYGSSGFSGSATQLTWDFSASPQPEAAFQLPGSFICFGPSGGLCAYGNQGNVAAYSVSGNNTAQTYTGVQVLGSVAAAAAVPEPATWAMMLAGFGLIGFAARKRSSIKTSVTYA